MVEQVNSLFEDLQKRVAKLEEAQAAPKTAAKSTSKAKAA